MLHRLKFKIVMQSPPFFSIIIPLYNKANYIVETLKSITNQSFKDFEIIIVNDGSTDHSLNIATTYLKKTTTSYNIVTQENKGLPATRNKGISLAKGNIIALLDADDLWHTQCLETLHNLYKEFPEASFYGLDYFEKHSNNKLIETKKNLNPSLQGKSFLVKDFFKANKYQPMVCQSTMAFKRVLPEPVFFNEKINYAEDVDFYLKYLTKYKLAYHYKPMATILCNVPGQITQNGIKNKTLPDLNYYEKIHPNNKSLKAYLDFKRYMYASQYKIIKDVNHFNKMTSAINFNNLSKKQVFLLKCPLFILKLLKQIKKYFLKFNIRITTFR